MEVFGCVRKWAPQVAARDPGACTVGSGDVGRSGNRSCVRASCLSSLLAGERKPQIRRAPKRLMFVYDYCGCYKDGAGRERRSLCFIPRFAASVNAVAFHGSITDCKILSDLAKPLPFKRKKYFRKIALFSLFFLSCILSLENVCGNVL